MDVQVIDAPVLNGLDRATVAPEHWEDLEHCQVCGRTDALEDLARARAEGGAGTVLAACLDCAHLFLRRRPAQSWFDAYYAAAWDARNREEGPARVPVADKVERFCAPHLPDRARVLDVGAGFGSQLLGFRERGHEVFGLERSEHRAAHVQRALGIPCACGPFEEAPLPDELDLVASHHVLEHVADPAAVIARAVAHLRPGGLVYVAVPNAWHEHPPQSVHFVPHLSLFTARSLERLLRAQGLEPVELRVDRELQVVARRADGDPAALPPAGEADRAALRERLTTWLTEGFGGTAGRHLLVWFKSRDKRTLYEASARPPRAALGLRAGEEIERRLPLLGRGVRGRLWPAAASRTARSLRVELRAPGSLPLTLRQPGEHAEVWVK